MKETFYEQQKYSEISAFCQNIVYNMILQFLNFQDGNIKSSQELLQNRKACIFSIDVRDETNGFTALMWASKRAHSEVRLNGHFLHFLSSLVII